MSIPEDFRNEADALPSVLRALLAAELAAGNTIAEVNSYFPAPPAGACFQLNGPVTTRPRESGSGLKFRDFRYPNFSGSFTDERGFYFILEPPVPPEPEPDMDAIRAAHEPKPYTPQPITSQPNTALGRFERSMLIDYEKWHDGVGYDLDAIAAATAPEREAIETVLLNRGPKDWRDIEALAALDSPAARNALQYASTHADHEIRLAVTRYAPHLVPNPQRTASLVRALQTARLYGGLSQAIDEAAEYHPKEVVEALLRGALARDGESAVHFAALLLFIHKQADEPFDWTHRPFLLRFNTEDRSARAAFFAELCEKIAIDPSPYL
ncbi:MAG TPA: hypothetical protein VH325_16690 [Bryobacteraceae bacterium]|nr:hypothetical protein [Bryobacteraceae bacterium]